MNGLRPRVVCNACCRALVKSRITLRYSRRNVRYLSTASEVESDLPNSYIPKPLSSSEVLRIAQKFKIPAPTKANISITPDDINKSHTLHGWLLLPKRKLGKELQFFQLRDSQGNILQLTSSRPLSNEITSETPISITGIIRQRPQGQRREGLGQFEMEVAEIQVLNTVKFTLPFQPAQAHGVNAATRARYRYLDLRNQTNAAYIRLRDRIIASCRDFLRKRHHFLEIETPILFKSTPEGAREFIVPTRRKGEVYALPQSPQQYKQILMASGVDRYFQVAKCFRDEDLRADRQPEFTQLDLEMAFSGSEHVMDVIENLVKEVWNIVLPGSVDTNIEFLRMSYEEAMRRYGSDKPDLRYGMVFKEILEDVAGNRLYAFVVKGGGKLSSKIRRAICDDAKGTSDEYIASAVYHNYPDTKRWIDSINRMNRDITDEEYHRLNEELGLEHNDVIFVSERPSTFQGGSTTLGRARILTIPHLIELNLVQPQKAEFKFLWVTDFPLFSPDLHETSDPGQGGIAGIRSTHHPFTAPQIQDLEYLTTEPLKVKGQHYDLVVNGIELGGGSVRIHDADLQHHILKEILQLPQHRIQEFGHLLEALASGCPPHAGIALGLDRMIALLAGTNSIRDVIAFPKTASGADALVGSPSPVDPKVLKEYHLSLIDG